MNEPDTPYDIVSFTKAGFGVTLRHNLEQSLSETVTACRFHPAGDKLLLTKGKIIGGVSG